MSIKLNAAITAITRLNSVNGWKENESYQDFHKAGKKSPLILTMSKEGVTVGEIKAEGKPGFGTWLSECFFGSKVNRDTSAIGKEFAVIFSDGTDYSKITEADLKASKLALTALKERAESKGKDVSGYTAALVSIAKALESKKPQVVATAASQPAAPAKPKVVAATAKPKATSFAGLVTDSAQTKAQFFSKLSQMCQALPYSKHAGLYSLAYEALRKNPDWTEFMSSPETTSIDKASQQIIANYFQSWFDSKESPGQNRGRADSDGSESGYGSDSSSSRAGSPVDQIPLPKPVRGLDPKSGNRMLGDAINQFATVRKVATEVKFTSATRKSATEAIINILKNKPGYKYVSTGKLEDRGLFYDGKRFDESRLTLYVIDGKVTAANVTFVKGLDTPRTIKLELSDDELAALTRSITTTVTVESKATRADMSAAWAARGIEVVN